MSFDASLSPQSMVSSVENAIAQANATAAANSARAADEARIQREWQEQQNARAMAFNASEAAKSRNWQEYMSNTAHQREIADLKAAGLNPVLSAMGGNGAAVTSGATAQGVTSAGAKGDVDTSANTAITNLLGSMLSYMANLNSASTSALASMANADKAAAASELVALIGADASKYSANQHYAASKYAADNQYNIAKHFPNSVWASGGSLVSVFDGIFSDLFGENWQSSFLSGVGDAASSAGSWLKKTFVDESSFKKLASFLNEKTRDKFERGYYNNRR